MVTTYMLKVSTRRAEYLAEQLGVKSLSRPQVSEMTAHLDAQLSAFRERPLDAGPYTLVWVKDRSVDPVALSHRLHQAGLIDARTDLGERSFRFRASRPPARL